MTTEDLSLLTEAERTLREQFDQAAANRRRLPSTAITPEQLTRLDQLVLPDNMRARMPMTKDKYLVKENPQLVLWERETRKFLRRLSPDHGHRVSAVMVYEWATGLRITELMAAAVPDPETGRMKQPWLSDLRVINRLLKFYFGRAGMTWIAGKKVAKAYRVRPGYFIKRHRPMTLTLYAEYCEGTLVA
jgi:hypothetical protein